MAKEPNGLGGDEVPLGDLTPDASWHGGPHTPPAPTFVQWAAHKNDERVFWFMVALACAVFLVIVFGMSQRNSPERMAAYIAPLSALAGVVFGYFFGERRSP